MPTLEENVNRVKAAKTAIGAAITAKGGTVGANDGLEDFAADIATIPSGGVEFSNAPANFSLIRNIRNLNVDVPSGVTSLESFKDCQGLISIDLPETVQSIDGYAFMNCTNLAHISMQNGITSLGNNVFVGCTSLTSIELPSTLTTIGSHTFQQCDSLTSIEIPSSVTSIGSYAFTSCINLEKIYVNKPENSISGSPWGAPNTTQIIWRTDRYQSSCTEVASGTTLTGTVNTTVGDLVVATFVIRGNTYTFDSGWTLLGIGDNGALNQRTAMAYKIATSSSESLTVTQDTAGRIYINLVSIPGASVGTFSGFTTQATGSSITLPKPQGLVIWGVSSAYWGTTSPYKLWDISDKSNVTAIQLPTTTQPRCLTALDQSDDSTVTFRYSPDLSGDAGLAAASLTITGIDNFWYYDNP